MEVEIREASKESNKEAKTEKQIMEKYKSTQSLTSEEFEKLQVSQDADGNTSFGFINQHITNPFRDGLD